MKTRTKVLVIGGAGILAVMTGIARGDIELDERQAASPATFRAAATYEDRHPVGDESVLIDLVRLAGWPSLDADTGFGTDDNGAYVLFASAQGTVRVEFYDSRHDGFSVVSIDGNQPTAHFYLNSPRYEDFLKARQADRTY